MKFWGRRTPETIVRVSDYRGQEDIQVAATQLGEKYTAAEDVGSWMSGASFSSEDQARFGICPS